MYILYMLNYFIREMCIPGDWKYIIRRYMYIHTIYIYIYCMWKQLLSLNYFIRGMCIPGDWKRIFFAGGCWFRVESDRNPTRSRAYNRLGKFASCLDRQGLLHKKAKGGAPYLWLSACCASRHILNSIDRWSFGERRTKKGFFAMVWSWIFIDTSVNPSKVMKLTSSK